MQPSDHARDAHLVLCGTRKPIPFACPSTVKLPAARTAWTRTRTRTGLLRDGRMYQLVHEHDAVREGTLEIRFLEPDAEAYLFTFG